MCPTSNVLAIDFCGPVVQYQPLRLVEHADGEYLGILVQEPPNITVGIEVTRLRLAVSHV